MVDISSYEVWTYFPPGLVFRGPYFRGPFFLVDQFTVDLFSVAVFSVDLPSYIRFFIYHGRKIAPVLYICPSTGTENNTELRVQYSGHGGLNFIATLPTKERTLFASPLDGTGSNPTINFWHI